MKEKVVPINKNKEPEIDSTGFFIKQLESFPTLERNVLQLSLGLGEPFEILHTTDEIAEILNESKEVIEKNLATGMKRMRDICDQERLRQENEDAYNEIRLQMHNRVIKKLRSLKEEWKLENISQVTERIMLAFFKNDLWKIFIDTWSKIIKIQFYSVKTYLISGLVDEYRIKTNLFAISPNHAIKVFQQKYPKAEDIFVIQNLSRGK